jgi:S-methylmethionine-dependent homocysteine/selenocysteine methylase
MTGIPERTDGRIWLTEGGVETEIMYKWGFELPQFAMFTLMENPEAVVAIRGMMREYLDAAAETDQAAFMSGFDYRASPDWGDTLGYSPESLADANIACIDFLKELAGEYSSDIAEIKVGGVIGPRGDAYSQNRAITAEEAEDYHSVQLATLKRAGVDIAGAATFNNIPEAIGLARAARKIGVPLSISFSVDETARLNSGPSVEEAVTAVDAQTDMAPDFYLLNCSHPEEFLPGLSDGPWTERMRGFRPNASKMEKISLCRLGHLEEGNPVELGALMGDLAERFPHMDVWGGCCGTGGHHLGIIARNVVERRGPR